MNTSYVISFMYVNIWFCVHLIIHLCSVSVRETFMNTFIFLTNKNENEKEISFDKCSWTSSFP